MQYCGKCRHVCEDGPGKCPNCRSSKLRPAGEGDMVFLCGADMYTAGKLNDALGAAGIECRMENMGHAYFNFDSASMPTDQNVYVPYESLERAREIAAEVAKEVEDERAPEDEESGGPSAKRIVGEILSVVAFLVLVMLAVYGADGIAGWLKGLLGIG